MSENIRGITFAEQVVTPADDAIVRRAILGDGILTGCEISYSGSTLTMAAGYIIACGRAFQITAAQNFAVVDATSGYARILLTIDLTQTATEDVFKQISFTIEYASAEDGFVELVQDDINLSGTKYQIVAAVVSLGTGGITSIISKLEQAEGGGDGLNFRVVDGLTQPATGKENDIWVAVEKVTGYYFQAEQPEEMADGEVWISTGTSSAVAFNALKKGTIMVYPLSAKQMVSGSLVDVTAKSYQDGEWVEWIPEGALYYPGLDYSDTWSTYDPVYTDQTVTFGECMVFYVPNKSTNGYGRRTSLHTETKDLSKYNTLKIAMKNDRAVTVGIATAIGENSNVWAASVQVPIQPEFTEVLLPFSGISTAMVAIRHDASVGNTPLTATFKSVLLE